MAKKLSYERYTWFHGRVKAGAFPNSTRLAERFEISRKQAQRDVAFLRDRLGAPLLYHPDPRGFGYEKDCIRRNFGVITGDHSTDVVLRFTPGVSHWIAEQPWYETQGGRGLKPLHEDTPLAPRQVAPCAGAWIETADQIP